MCFGGGGPSKEEKQASVEQRLEADEAKRDQVEKRAEQKRDDIEANLKKRDTSTTASILSGGKGGRSLFRSSGGGFLGRYGS